MGSPIRRVWDHDLAWSFRRSPVAVAAAAFTAICLLAAVLAPWLAPHDPFDLASLDLNDAFSPPAWTEAGHPTYLLGTDDQGRDLLSAILYGARISLGVSLVAVLLAALIGVTFGSSPVTAAAGSTRSSCASRTSSCPFPRS